MKRSAITKSILAFVLLAGLLLSASLTLTGCLTDDNKTGSVIKKDSTMAKKDSTPWGPPTTVTVGAQGNLTYGSALDLDAKKVLKVPDAMAAQGTIDLVFIFTGGDLKLASPVAAKAAGDVPLAAAYDTTKIKDTQIATTSTRPETSEIADTTYTQTFKVDNVFAVEGSFGYLVKTDKGKLAYVHIEQITGEGDTATAVLTIQPSGL